MEIILVIIVLQAAVLLVALYLYDPLKSVEETLDEDDERAAAYFKDRDND